MEFDDKNDSIAELLGEFAWLGCPRQIERLGSAGGFSGARLWRLKFDLPASGVSEFCLRCWPEEHPGPEQLRFIHAVLRHVVQQGFSLVSVPVQTSHGASFVEHRGRLWELSPWLPGVADFHADPQPEKLAAAMRALAQFHAAAATFSDAPVHSGLSPGLAQRRQTIAELQRGGWQAIAAAVNAQPAGELKTRAEKILAGFTIVADRIAAELATAARENTPLQPCIRDVWHDHVLFSGRTVTGLIDFGAMRVESVAGDIARLLGSLVGDDPAAWNAGLQAYESIRPLSPQQLRLIGVFDRSSVALSGMNWLRWLLLEHRQFENPRRVLDRLDEAIRRLDKKRAGSS